MARLFGDAYASVSDPWLRRACDLAERGRGTTSPNPPVGCVVVRDGIVVGEGFHERAGEPHAEAIALAAAGPSARGATAFVTLEPCAHTGRTPPCADALISAGVGRVVVGMPDPTPLAAGGAARLRAAGIDVRFAPDPAPFESLLEEWSLARSAGRPFVRVKTALTLDGHASLQAGERAALTGDEARELTMRLRERADAVLVGCGTAAIDDPVLTVRTADGSRAGRQPLRVVLCRDHLPPSGTRLLRDAAGPVALLVPEQRASGAAGMAGSASVIGYDTTAGVRGALTALAAERGVVSVLVEAGPGMMTALAGAELVDELVLYHAGTFAGAEAPALVPERSAGGFRVVETGIVGEDAVTVWRPIGCAT